MNEVVQRSRDYRRESETEETLSPGMELWVVMTPQKVGAKWRSRDVVVGDGTGDGEGDDVAGEGDTIFGIVFSLSINLFQLIKRVRDYFNYYFQYPEMASEEGQLISCHTLNQWNNHLQTAEDPKKLVF
ncbi:Thioredoxin H1 [Camellia lanceoleosa]|uniref:Thioredoxin H1 n=1 Tax=Camellia lanceoleosa TaxID=1840588 RepID=A0ACC0H7N6_9ERIC|nr:Thioredoxin H1 [Camellia lanceoleosa]